MNTNTVKAISYITSVACEEMTLREWLCIITAVTKNGEVPADITLATVINYFAEKFPDFVKRADNVDQKSYDELYEDFIAFMKKMTKTEDI